MATFLQVGDILEYKMFCRNLSQNGVNVVHYKVTAVAGASVLDSFAAGILDGVAAAAYKNYLPTICSYSGSRLQIIAPGPAQVAQIVTSNSGAGTIASDPLHSVSSLLISKRTQLAGRKNRGRTYLPFWAESQNDANGRPTAGALILAGAWASGLLASRNIANGANTADIAPVIYNRGPGTTQPLVGTLIRTEWATQRRRSELNRGDQVGP